MGRQTIINQSRNIPSLVEFVLGDADRLDSFRQNCGITPLVPQPSDWIGMPKGAVCFERDIAMRKEKVNAIAADFIFLDECDPEIFERFPNQSFRSRLSEFGLNAGSGAKAPVLTYGRLARVLALAPFTRLKHIPLKSLAHALVGAIKRVLRSHAPEQHATHAADVFAFRHARLVIAGTRAMYWRLAAHVTYRSKDRPALRAVFGLRAIARSLKTSARTKTDLPFITFSTNEGLAASLAGLAASDSTFTRTEPATNTFGRTYLKPISAGLTDYRNAITRLPKILTRLRAVAGRPGRVSREVLASAPGTDMDHWAFYCNKRQALLAG